MTVIQFGGEGALPSLPPDNKEMMSVRTVNDRTWVRINSSSLSIIQECMRKAHYSLHEGWKAREEGAATLFGRAIHKALEVFYKGTPDERVLPKLEYLEMMSYGHKPPPTNNDLLYRAVQAFLDVAQPLSELPPENKRSLQNGIWILHEYFKAFIDDPYTAYSDDQGPFIERSFTLRIHEDRHLIIDLFGTVDFAFRHTVTKDIILGDHKTASYLTFGDSNYFDRDKPNHQYTAYMMGAREVFGIKTEDFMVNVIEVKARPKTAKAKGVSFPRQITKRTEEDFAEFKELLIYETIRYLGAIDLQYWPMGSIGACQAYGGCQYKQVCASPKSLRETLLTNKFTKGDPNAITE